MSIILNGAHLVPDRAGAMFWPERKTLVVADLHFEKGSAFAGRGQLLPPYDTNTTLRTLEGCLKRYDAERVICLGDSFDDTGAGERLSPENRKRLQSMIKGRDWIWITGNHDPDIPTDLAGNPMPQLTDGALTFRHEAEADRSRIPSGEISGHFHPKARIKTKARSISSRCFISDGKRMIMPSFGAYTGGLAVSDPAIQTLFPAGFKIWLLGRDRVHAFPGAAAA